MLADVGVGSVHSSLPVAGLVWLLVLASVTAVVARWIHMPYTVALVLVGLAASVLGVLSDVRPTSDVILLVFLPPLLFEASLQLDLAPLGRSFLGIVLLAVPGVVASAILIGVSLAWLTPLTIWPALLFGAFISATDPVAVV